MSTPNQMLAMVRKLIADEQGVGFSKDAGTADNPQGTQELQNYLNRAVNEYSKRQAASKDVRLMKEADVTDGSTLPEDYISFCGGMPVKVLGRTVKFYIPAQSISVRYFARLPYVNSVGDGEELPYEEDQAIAICALAAIYALNKHEYDISRHLLLLGYGADHASQQSSS